MTDAHESPDQLPRPQVGAGSNELQSDSQDVDELRGLLARARERLSFYEGFDRIIGENVKRSGELMLETITLREKADEATHQANLLRDNLEATLAAERKRHQDMLAELGQALDHLTGQVEMFRLKLTGTVQAISGLAPDPVATGANGGAASSAIPDAAAATIATEAGGVPVEPVAPASDPDIAAVTTTPAPAKPEANRARTVDALFHGIPDPATALQLQRYLGDLDTVSSVQAREFADGILRLQVSVSRPLTADDFAAWSGSRALQVVREQWNVIEIRLT